MRRWGGELQESDGDHLIEFAGRLETGMRCFQRQVQTTDRKVQEARRKTTTTPNHLERKDVERDEAVDTLGRMIRAFKAKSLFNKGEEEK